MSSDRQHRAWQAAARLLKQREEELRAMTTHWEQGLVALRPLMDLRHEVNELRDFECNLFDKAFPGRIAASRASRDVNGHHFLSARRQA